MILDIELVPDECTFPYFQLFYLRKTVMRDSESTDSTPTNRSCKIKIKLLSMRRLLETFRLSVRSQIKNHTILLSETISEANSLKQSGILVPKEIRLYAKKIPL